MAVESHLRWYSIRRTYRWRARLKMEVSLSEWCWRNAAMRSRHDIRRGDMTVDVLVTGVNCWDTDDARDVAVVIPQWVEVHRTRGNRRRTPFPNAKRSNFRFFRITQRRHKMLRHTLKHNLGNICSTRCSTRLTHVDALHASSEKALLVDVSWVKTAAVTRTTPGT